MQPRPPSDPRLRRVLSQLETLIDWERLDRSAVGPGKRAMRVDVAPIQDLLARLGRPERRFRAVHVAGTKGKGSVSALVEAGLLRAGLATGRYASPHVEQITERLSLLGRPVREDQLAQLLERAFAAREDAVRAGSGGRDSTWFDVLTAACFLGLAEAGVEWGVIECGLGGRLDSTNAVCGEVSVVTNVELEHTGVLGFTRAAIAAEKGAILEPRTVLVTGVAAGASGDEAGAVLDRIAEDRCARIVRPALPSGAALRDFEDLNAALAGAVLDELGRARVRVSSAKAQADSVGAELGGPELVGAWLLDPATRAAARLPGRLERIELELAGARLPLILDGAHVAGSLETLFAVLDGREGISGSCTCVFAAGKDKDVPGLLKVLAGRVDRLLCTSAGTGLGRAPHEIREAAEALGLVAEVAQNPMDALDRALADAATIRHATGRVGWILVTGSLHLVGALRAGLRERSGNATWQPSC